MKRRIVGLALSFLLGMLLGGVPLQAQAPEGFDVAIRIAPQTLLLNSSQGGWVTVHADIPYTLVDTRSLMLNGVAVTFTKADLTGDLVAKFKETLIKSRVTPPTAALTLTGVTRDGKKFYGVATVAVKARPR